MAERFEPETSSRRQRDIIGGGRIGRSSAARVILAVAFLILVTLISFLAVILISDLVVPSQLTYWMIELIFALLCGGAGALVGGSAVVRSTLKIPGSPVQATLGGAVSMIIVGFAIAYLASPAPEDQTYTLEIHDLPQTHPIGGVVYNVYVGPEGNDPLSFSRDQYSVAIKIPMRATTYKAKIAIYRSESDRSTTFARCMLTFYTTDAAGNSLAPMELVPGRDLRFRLHLARNYIDKVVKASVHAGKAIENEPCVEGIVATKKNERTPLSGHFTFIPTSTEVRLRSLAHLTLLPRYSVLASDVSDIDPEDTLPDLSAGATQLGGGTVTAQLPEAQPSPKVSLEKAISKPADTAQQPPTSESEEASQTKNKLYAQVNAYVEGENFDRTQLYQSWSEVADYVVNGFRTAYDNNQKAAASYLNLISNALSVIDDGNYLPPTRHPNGDGSKKPDRLAKNNGVPAFGPGDYKKVVTLLCSGNDSGRHAAQRLLKLYPSDNFYRYLQSLSKSEEIANCDLTFISETAILYFYNRIVEYDGTFALDKKSRDWIVGNYDDGVAWVSRPVAKDPSFKIYSSMLDYAYGLVLWDHGDQAGGLRHISRMMETIRSSNTIYPSNPRHIAIALKLLHDPSYALKTVRPLVAYVGEPVAAGKEHVIKGQLVSLFAVPEESGKLIANVRSDMTARVYLRGDNWDLLHAGDRIGWARRVVTSASN
jgi:hypothetical protein